MQSTANVSGGETPLAALARLAASGATGELVVASDAIELHVYLLEGRLAWATTSTRRQTFLHHLVEEHGVSADAVREVVAECQRSRKRLGETLIGWGVASAAQVRDALAAQIGEALEAAQAHPGARTLFLSRRMNYDLALTFSLDELAPGPRAHGGDIDLEALGASLIATVLDSIQEAQWVEVTGPAGCAARAARGTSRSVVELAIPREVLHGHRIESLVVRTRDGVLLGQVLPGQAASIWCAAGPGVKLGVATTVLAGAVGVTAVAPSAPPSAAGGWHEVPGPTEGANSVITSAMKTADDLIAGLVLHDDGRAHGVCRGPAFDEHVEVARGLLPLLGLQLARAGSGDALAYHESSLRGVRGALAYHGARVAGRRAAVWLALPTGASQGLGWALLQTVSRQVADAPGGEW